MTSDDLYSIGWRLTGELGVETGPTWKVEDQGSMEIWAGGRYFVVSRPDPETFIVTEEEDDVNATTMKDRKEWVLWQDAADDIIFRIRDK